MADFVPPFVSETAVRPATTINPQDEAINYKDFIPSKSRLKARTSHLQEPEPKGMHMPTEVKVELPADRDFCPKDDLERMKQEAMGHAKVRNAERLERGKVISGRKEEARKVLADGSTSAKDKAYAASTIAGGDEEELDRMIARLRAKVQ